MNAAIHPKGRTAHPKERAGWHAHLTLDFALRGDRSKMVKRTRSGPLSVQRGFYPEGSVCHSYLLHPPGGVVGGDQLHITCRVDSGAQALVTTPGATKFYRSLGEPSIQTQNLKVADDASLEWLPQETIYFSGAQARLTTQIDLAPHARFIGWEMHCAGRPVMAERFESGRVWTGLTLNKAGRVVLADHSQLGAQFNQGSHRGHPMQSTWIGTGAGQVELDLAREVLRDFDLLAGATLIDDFLVVRALCQSTDQVLPGWIALWQALRPSLIGREPCAPRIWNT